MDPGAAVDRYTAVLCRHWHNLRVYRFGGRAKLRYWRFLRFRSTQRHIEETVSRFLAHVRPPERGGRRDDPVLIFYGTGSFAPGTRGAPPGPHRDFLKALVQRPGVVVVLTDEYRTSKKCALDGTDLKDITKRTGGEQDKYGNPAVPNLVSARWERWRDCRHQTGGVRRQQRQERRPHRIAMKEKRKDDRAVSIRDDAQEGGAASVGNSAARDWEAITATTARPFRTQGETTIVPEGQSGTMTGGEEEDEDVDNAPADPNVARSNRDQGGGRLRWCTSCEAYVHRDTNGAANIRLHGLTMICGGRRREGFEREEEEKDRRRKRAEKST